MALLDFFKKRKKKKEKKAEKKPAFAKAAVGKEAKKEVKMEALRVKKKAPGSAYRILRSPHVTEKATLLGEKNEYVFKVGPRTNKTEIKKTIEGIYGVDVMEVKIINIPKKQRRLGRQKGWRKGYKKAIVKIKKGQKIEILPR